MNLIRKFFQTKKDIQKYIEENGMESAIKEIGVKKLCYFKLLSLYVDISPFKLSVMSFMILPLTREGE